MPPLFAYSSQERFMEEVLAIKIFTHRNQTTSKENYNKAHGNKNETKVFPGVKVEK